jgi:hypothetical protein
MAAMTRNDTADGLRTFGVAILTDNPTLVLTTLKTAIEVAVGALKTFGVIFPERFTIMGFDEIERLIGFLKSGPAESVGARPGTFRPRGLTSRHTSEGVPI